MAEQSEVTVTVGRKRGSPEHLRGSPCWSPIGRYSQRSGHPSELAHATRTTHLDDRSLVRDQVFLFVYDEVNQQWSLVVLLLGFPGLASGLVPDQAAILVKIPKHRED